MLARTLVIGSAMLLSTACGSGRDVRFVVETEGEARATAVVLRIDAETRFYESVSHGQEIVERDVQEGAQVALVARNGGEGGAVVIRAFLDACEVEQERCEGTGCEASVDLVVREGCG